MHALTDNDIGDIIGKANSKFFVKQPRQLAVADELIADNLVVRHFKVQPFTDFFKGVTKRTMPQVMHECRG